MIKGLIRAVLINSFALYLSSQYIAGFHLSHGLQSFAAVVGAFTLAHFFLKPALKLFLGALNFLTFGLISLLIDVTILYGLSFFLPQISFSNWYFSGFSYGGAIVPPYNFSPIGSTIVTALLTSTIRAFLNYLAE